MNILERLRSFGAYIMDDHGNITDFSPNPLTWQAADEIEMLREERDYWMEKSFKNDPPDI